MVKTTKAQKLKTANRILKKGYMIKWSVKKDNWVQGRKNNSW
jgi:hypothetical protein